MNFSPALISIALTSFSLNSEVNIPILPTIEILGKNYYYHDVEKGESIYGIARQHNWNLDELIRLNPTASSRIKKGMRLYYPVEDGFKPVEAVSTESELPVSEPIKHHVKRGETVYSIAKKYDVPVEAIYTNNPSSKKGIKAGEILLIDQPHTGDTTKFVFYEIKPGDTLFSVAKRYRTSIEEIMAANPGLSENRFQSGDLIRISPDTESNRMYTKVVSENRVANINTYKAKKNDTWTSISKKTGVEVETLKEANETIDEPEKNELIAVPVLETIQIEKEVVAQDPRELSPEGVREIYDSIHGIDNSRANLEEVKIAMLLDEPTGKKDIDFLRGFLLQLDNMKSSPFKINLKVLDGRQSATTITETLEGFSPNLIFATADKTFPKMLADYGDKNNIEVINVFDVKSDLYESSPSIVHLLPPSSLFNELIAEELATRYSYSKWLVIDGKDDNDAIFTETVKHLGNKILTTVPSNRLIETNFTAGDTYVLYVTSQKKDEVQQILNTVDALALENPGVNFVVLGRPNWVTFTEIFKERFHGGDIVVPARCWFDPESNEGKVFYDIFTDTYGQPPVKSFPNFAASGFDVAGYFINLASDTGGDFNRKSTSIMKTGLQTDYDITRTSNWSGFLNPLSYVLTFKPSGLVEKKIVK